MKSNFLRGLRRGALLLGLTLLLAALISCGEGEAVPPEDNTQPTLTASGRVVDVAADEIPKSVYGDIRNIYYTLYNMQVPMLYVKLPEKAASYGFAARDTSDLDAFLESECIDTLDAVGLFAADPDAYYGRYSESFNADGAIELAKQIIGVMPEYYSLMLDGAKNFEDGYYERVDCAGCGHSDLTNDGEGGWYYCGAPVKESDAETLEKEFTAEDYFYYRPTRKTEYRLRCYGKGTGSKGMQSGSYDEVVFDSVALNTALAEGKTPDASLLMLKPDAAAVTLFNQNNAALNNHVYLDRGVNLLLLHNLDDLTLAAILADSVTKVTAVDIRKFKEETLVSYLKDDKAYDLAVMAIVPDGNWENINRGSDVVNVAYSDETDHTSLAVKDNHRMLQVCYPVCKNIDAYVKNMVGLQATCDELGTELIFVQTAYKNFPGYTELPGGLVDHAQENSTNFLTGLQKNDIRTIDLRTRILEDIPGDQVFYKTDHHWKAESGFWAAGQIIDYLRSELGWSELDPDGKLLSADSYEFEVRPHDFMAHFGKDYAHSMVGCDDFVLIYPKFDTKFVMTIDRNGKKETTKGSFYEALFTKHYLQGKDPCAYNRYAAYLNGDQPLIKIENQTEGIAKSDKKVLVVKCSFANAVNPYLAMNFETFQIIDLRHYKLATLTEFIKQNHFDLVMFIYNPNLYSNNQTMFRFE